MFFWKKKKKHVLPFAGRKEAEQKSYPTAPRPAYNPLAEKFANASEEEDCLKNFVILYRDRTMAESVGDPMIKVIQAYSESEAALEASRVINGKYEVMAIRFNGEVEYPNRESNFAFPTAQRNGPRKEENLSIGEIMRLKGKDR